MRISGCADKTLHATGLNASSKYKMQYRQVAAIVDEETFNIIKAEAVRSNVSISEILRQCIDLVLK